jgi:hypothetical protein
MGVRQLADQGERDAEVLGRGLALGVSKPAVIRACAAAATALSSIQLAGDAEGQPQQDRFSDRREP